MSLIEEVGIETSSPAETILTTFNPKGDPHLAAIGIRKKNEKRIELKLFAGSQTYHNIRNRKAAVANIIDDPIFLIKQGLPEIFDQRKKSCKIEEAKTVNAPIISDANAVIEFVIDKEKTKQITDEIGTSKIIEVTGLVKNIEIRNPKPHPFKRTEFYLLETAIIATKAIEAEKNGKENISKKFIEEIKLLKDKCKKIAPNSQEMDVISEILNYFKR